MVSSLGIPELLVLGLVLLLLFGGKWLARVGSVVGKAAKRNLLAPRLALTFATGNHEKIRRAERDLGRAMASEVLQQYDAPVAEAKQLSLAKLGAKLLAAGKTPRECSYRVIAGPVTNALALPGGFIFIFEPLLDAFQDDDDAVAFILAHEMGHVLLGHAREGLVSEFLLHRATANSGGVGTLLKTLIAQGRSQEAELEADRYAVSLLATAGFDTSGATRVLEAFRRMAGTDQPAFVEYFSSHPSAEVRLKRLTENSAFS